MTVAQTHFERQRPGYQISTDPARIDLDQVCRFLSLSYWAQTRPRDTIERSIRNSLCFGIYRVDRSGGDDIQVGFARVVTDRATFAWLCDVFVDEEARGDGLGKWLIESILDHPELQHLRRWILATGDAHELYRRFGFTELQSPERWMERRE